MKKIKPLPLFIILLFLILLEGCSRNNYPKAFKGEMMDTNKDKQIVETSEKKTENETSNRDFLVQDESQFKTKIKTKETTEALIEEDLQGLKDQIEFYLKIKEIDPYSLSIYITDLKNGSEYKLNPTIPFRAASTYKLPLAMLVYDAINTGVISAETAYIYEWQHYEGGGPLPDTYGVGQAIPIDYLLRVMIAYSDNTSAHILYENLGGWEAYRLAAEKYSNHPINRRFHELGNYLTTQYSNDLLIYLYNRPEEYTDLLELMKISFPENYLNLNLPYSTYQKHGCYAEFYSSIGLVCEQNPYAISILTNLGPSGEEHIGNINEIAYYYFVN